MAYFERLVDRTGVPKSPAVPGGPPRPSMPAPVKNPPAVATGPVGRPSSPVPPFAGGAGPALPTSPQAARPATRPSTPAPSPTAPQPATAPAPSQPTTMPGAASLAVNYNKVPSKYELGQVPEGTNVNTPYGPIDRAGNISFTPEGEVKYKEAVVQRRKQFGPHPWAGDPNAPQPPARMGGWMLNPFTGQWAK